MSLPTTGAKVANPVQAAIAAFAKGQDPIAAVYGNASGPSMPGIAKDESAQPTTSANQSPPADTQQTQGSEGNESQNASDEANDSQDQPDSEDIVVTDDSGRRKLKVDYKDRAKIKKAYELAAGMRKFQAERDKALARAKEAEPVLAEHADLKKSWGALEEAFDKNGVAGLVNLLSKKPGSYESFIEAEVERRNRKATASPSELKQIELEERLEASERLANQREKQVQEYLEKGKSERETAEKRAAESVLHPTFNKYRFAGQLGDEGLEGRLDSAIWEQSRAELNKLPDDVDITPAMVDKTFRDIATSFRRAIKGQAERTTKQVLETRKVNASEAAAAAATSSRPKVTGARESVLSDMKSGNLKNSIMAALTGKMKF